MAELGPHSSVICRHATDRDMNFPAPRGTFR
jgi:hypothetical protein